MTDYAFDRDALVDRESLKDREMTWNRDTDTVMMLLVYLFDVKVYISPTAESEIETDLLGLVTLLKHIQGWSETDVTIPDAELSKFIRHLITYTGDFSPGDTLEINMDNMTVRKNGINALKDIEGDFFELLEGLSEVKYSDVEGQRNIRMTVSKNDRYL